MQSIMNISKEKKLDVLLAQLQERYEALHKMRDRSMQFVLWILGLGLGILSQTVFKQLEEMGFELYPVLRETPGLFSYRCSI